VPERFTENFAASSASYGARPCIQFEGQWYSGDDITAYADAIASVLRDAGVADDAPVGLVVGNRLPHAAAIIGFLAAGRTVSMIYSFQSPESIGRDIEKLQLSAIVAERRDWADEVIAAAGYAGSAGVAISLTAPLVAAVTGLERRDECRRHAEAEPVVALQILTSGTTGPPKRQAIKTPVLERTVFSVTRGEAAPPDAPPEFAYRQFGGIGVCQLVAGVHNARRIVMLERFTVYGFVHAITSHRIKRSGVQPAVRNAAGCRCPQTGSGVTGFPDQCIGPTGSRNARRVRGALRYLDPVGLWCNRIRGSLCAWTPDLISDFGSDNRDKRNSVGRPLPDTRVRVVDSIRTPGPNCPPDTMACWRRKWPHQSRLDPHHRHRLDRLRRVRHLARQGRWRDQPGWIQDLAGDSSACLDFTPGGPRRLRSRGPDARLGQVPFAAIEINPGVPPPSDDDLKDRVRQALPVYYVPVAFAVVDELPRNPALKVGMPAVAALYEPR